MIEAGAWLCVLVIGYTYVGYQFLVAIIGCIFDRSVAKDAIDLSVVVVISAYNEEREIQATVQNKLLSDYPPELLSVIVVSDGSSDNTDELVESLSAESQGRVTLLRQSPRQGKTQALNRAVSVASSDIVVFSDANSIYEPGAIRALVRNFADPSVGYVTGRMVYTNPSDSAVGKGVGTYMGYENLLRSLETRVGSVVGADGGIDAVRRELYMPMRADQLPDFVLPLSVVEQGKRAVYEPAAVLFEPALARVSEEIRMRVRVALRALWAIYDKRALLNPIRYPVFAWQLLSHKVLRYLAFIPLGALFALSGLAALSQPFWQWIFLVQVVCLGAAFVGHLLKGRPGIARTLITPYYFLILNISCVIAFWKFVNGEKMTLWKPRTGN